MNTKNEPMQDSRHLVCNDWLGANVIVRPGYYWCRLTDGDRNPSIVKITDDQASDDSMSLWEFEFDERQRLDSYGKEWEFLPVTLPNAEISNGSAKNKD